MSWEESEQPATNNVDPVRIAMANWVSLGTESFITKARLAKPALRRKLPTWPSAVTIFRLANRRFAKTKPISAHKIIKKNLIFLWSSGCSLVDFLASFWPTGRRWPTNKGELRPKNQFFDCGSEEKSSQKNNKNRQKSGKQGSLQESLCQKGGSQ